MKRLGAVLNRGEVSIKWGTILAIIGIILFIYVNIGNSVVGEIYRVIGSGYLDGIELHGDNIYTRAGGEFTTYTTYRTAVAMGEANKFNYATDGFSYVDTLGFGYKTFVFDYRWYGGSGFDVDKILHYIDSNYWLMVARMVVFSNQFVVATLIFLGLLLLNYWIYPIITHALTSAFGFIMAIRSVLAKDGRDMNVRVYEARLLRKTVEEYEGKRSLYWISGVIALVVSLYTVRYQEDTAVFVAVWVDTIVAIVFLLNKIVIQHIRLAKGHKDKELDEEEQF